MTLLLKETTEARILRIADSLQPEMRVAFLAAVEVFKRSIPVGELTELLEEGKLEEALDQTFSVFDELQGKLKEELAETLIEIVKHPAQVAAAEFGLEFTLVDERAIRFATEQAGRLIVEIGAETQQAIADIVSIGLRQGVAPRQQSLLIREIVGLTRRDALAVDRFLQGAIDSGLNRVQARDQAKRMAARLLKRRAENIARTETIRAANMGTQLGWDAAQDAGLLPQGTQKVWIATGDSRLCPICALLDGNTVDLGGNFDVSQEATVFTIDGQEIKVTGTPRPLKRPSTPRTPPAHPSCRCTIGVELVEKPSSEITAEDSIVTPSPCQSPLFTKLVQQGIFKAEDVCVTTWSEAVKASEDWEPEGDTIEDWTDGTTVKGIRKSQITDKGTKGLKDAKALADTLEDAPRWEGKIYRGIDMPLDDAQTFIGDLEKAKLTGTPYTQDAFASYSTDRKVADVFAEGEVGFVFSVEKSSSGRALGRHSIKPSGGLLEKEVIMSKGTEYKVTDVNFTPRKVKDDSGFHWVYDIKMEETAP